MNWQLLAWVLLVILLMWMTIDSSFGAAISWVRQFPAAMLGKLPRRVFFQEIGVVELRVAILILISLAIAASILLLSNFNESSKWPWHYLPLLAMALTVFLGIVLGWYECRSAVRFRLRLARSRFLRIANNLDEHWPLDSAIIEGLRFRGEKDSPWVACDVRFLFPFSETIGRLACRVDDKIYCFELASHPSSPKVICSLTGALPPKEMAIYVLDSDGQPVIRWRMYHALALGSGVFIADCECLPVSSPI